LSISFVKSCSKSPGLRRQVILLLAAGLICFLNLGVAGLWDLDEALYSSIAREMGLRGDWVVTTFNARAFCEKPPLMFWLMMGSFKFLGVSEFAARLPAAILAIGTTLATYRLARRLFSAEVAFWAGLATTSNIIFTISARAATVDSALVFVTTLAMALFAKGARLGETVEGVGRIANPSHLAYRPTSWSTYAVIGILLGLAVLAKGPVGFLLPAASLGLFLLVMNAGGLGWQDRGRALAVPPSGGPLTATPPVFDADLFRKLFWQIVKLFSPFHLLRVTWSMRPLTVLSFASLVALPWYAAITWRTHGEWLAQFVNKYNLGPFGKPFLGHDGPFYYHFVVVLVGLFPWSVFLGPTIVNAYRAIRARGKDLPSYVFVVCWIGVFFGFWSLCSTKLPHYVLPAYPALAILTGCFLHAWIERSAPAARHMMPIATTIFLAVGVAMLAVLPWVTARYAPGEQSVAFLGLVPALGGGLCWYFLVRGRRRSYAVAFAAASVLFIAMFFGWAAIRIDRHQHSRPLLEEVRRDSPGEPQIAGYKYCDASTVFYAGGPVAECGDAVKLGEFLDRSPRPYIVTTGDQVENLESQMPGPWRVVARRPRFLGKGEIVVLAPDGADSARRGGISPSEARSPGAPVVPQIFR
jgi:4-amino-4-deoxy-L-arabinose transferase-like glycosyltransferase